MAKKLDLAKEKAKRQKKIAIVGGVLLVALLAFQLPRTMKMLKNPGNVTTSSSTTSASTTPGSTPLAPPTLEGGASTDSTSSGVAASADTSKDGVRDPSTPLPPDSGQLISFSRFKSKDPFRQQVTPCGTEACETGTPPSAGAAVATSSGTGNSGGGTSSSAGGSGSSGGGAKPQPTAAAPAAPATVTSALISVNGKSETVSVGKTFPAADPVFVLIKATAKDASISISGGTIEGGTPTIRLQVGKSVTLQNTADGTQYVLKLLRTS
jgi:hypothetical protein